MPTIAEVRARYPQYNDMSDTQLADALHTKYYSDMPKTDFYNRVGLSSGQKIYGEQIGPAQTLADTVVGTLERKPGGQNVLVPKPDADPSWTGGIQRGVAGGLRDLAVGVARAPFDIGPAAGAVIPGLIGEAFGVPADENPVVQSLAGLQPGANEIAKSISQTLPQIQQNTVIGDITQGVTPFATAALATGGGSIIPSTVGGTLADFIATDPEKASTLGDVIGGPTAISPQDTALTRRAKVAAESGPMEMAVRGGAKLLGAAKGAVVDPLMRKAGLGAQVPTAAQKELADLVRRDIPKFEQNLASVEAANQIARDTGVIAKDAAGLQPTVAELTGNDLLLNRQREAIASNELDGQLLDRVRQNAQIMENTPRAVAAQQGTPTLGIADFGQQSQTVMRPDVEARQAAIEAPMVQSQQKVDDAIAALEVQGRDVGDVGAQVREDLVRAEDERLRAAASQKFQESGADKIRTDQLPNTTAELAAQKAEMQGAITPSAVKSPMREASASAAEIKKRTTPTDVDTGLVDAQGNPIIRQKPAEGVSAQDLQTSRSVLGSKAYEAKQSGKGYEAQLYGRQAAAVDADLDAMEQVLEDAAVASGDTNAIAQIKEGRALTKERKALGGEGTKGGDVLRTKNTSGDYALADAQVLKKLFTGNKNEVSRYLDVLDRGDYRDVKDAVKEGIAKLYTSKYTTNGKANPAKHRAFLEEYGQAGERLWGKDWTKVSAIGNMAEEADKIAKTTKTALDTFNKMIPTKLAGVGPNSVDPVELYDTLAKQANPAQRTEYTKAYKLAVSRNKPELWDEYKAMRAEDWIDNITDQSTEGQRKLGVSKGDKVISPVKFAEALSEKTPEARETVAELKLLFGTDFVDNMKTLQEASKVFERAIPSMSKTDADASVVKQIKEAFKFARVVSGYFGPAGRTLTRVQDMTIAQQRKAAAVMMEDPKFILEIAKAMKDPKSIAKMNRLYQMAVTRGILAAGDAEKPTDNNSNSEMEKAKQ